MPLSDLVSVLGQPRPFQLPGICPQTLAGNLWLGRDPQGQPLQICAFEAPTPLTDGRLEKAWEARRAGTAAFVLIAAVSEDTIDLAGPVTRQGTLPIARGIKFSDAARILKIAKESPDCFSASRFLQLALGSTLTRLPGVNNSGLFADHVLDEVLNEPSSSYHKECKEAASKALTLLAKSPREIIQGLGYKVTSNDSRTDILLDADNREMALAVLLHENESPDSASAAFNNQTPITHALTQAGRRNLKWVITLAPDRTMRLYPATLNVGVGRRGATETFVEIHAGLLKEEGAGLLWMLFSAEALEPRGTVARLLDDSARFSGSLAKDLRERIYVEVMPRLAKGIADARRHPNKDAAFLRDALQMATHVLFRLLFIAYAEDKDLLPYAYSSSYQKSSLKAMAQEILEAIRKGVAFGETTRLWDQVAVLCDSISKGNKVLDVPAYNGVLFSSDKDDSPHGAAISKVKLTDSVFGHVLAGLLLTKGKEGELGAVDFRSLGVREFGTIYEGLLESELSEAKEDMALVKKDGDLVYVPTKDKKSAAVLEGEFYLHNKSGARKSSGAYFTKEFAVDHLLELALDKALDVHLAKVSGAAKTSEHDAADLLFDFRVADIAMGSGHFLIYAIDRIERRYRDFLLSTPLPPVRAQLNELRQAARAELGDSAGMLEGRLEDTALLRRLIARRCIYGVDMNPISVQLAQLAVWIHTFVPGLPLSFLEHNLIQGNSLVGVANQRDFEDLLDDARLIVKGYLDDALPDIRKMGAIADKNVADVKEMKKLRAAALKKLEPAFAAMDIAVWNRASGKTAGKDADDIMGLLQEPEKLLRSNALRDARKGLAPIGCRHLIACFPEVFLRKNPGFDVLLGNPPWEKVKFEKSMFFGRHIPGYYGMAQAERGKAEKSLERSMPNMKQLLEEAQAEAEVASTALGNLYSDQKGNHRFGVSAGDPDLFRMFAWRFWELLSQGGRIGVVLPRSAFSGDGLVEWRTQLLGAAKGTEENAAEVVITSVVNTGGWVFDDIHQQYTVSLCAIHKNRGKNELLLNGPFNCIADFNKARLKYARFPAAEVLNWTESAKLPLLPSAKAQDAFRKIRQAPNMVGEYDINALWCCRPYSELHATGDKEFYDLSGKKPGGDPMPIFKGESFDLWEPDRGPDRYYGWTKSRQETINELYRKRKSSFRRGANSPWWGAEDSLIHDKKTIECLHPRIAFRDITRATDTRTTRLALLPPGVVSVHNAPVLVFPKGSQTDVAYVLGILSSRICDWYSRRWVEVHLTFSIFNCLPCPRVPSAHPLYKELVAAAGRLASPDKRFAKWAKPVGVDCGPLKPEEKQELVDRVDAVAALLYGLSEQELETVFETFHEGWDWKPDHARVLSEYRRLKTKLKI